jgi:hypothetical protein|tara:strand:+ start:198 stop:800 length:603 start_codon:yes stop_codon:yes gene_type:complete
MVQIEIKRLGVKLNFENISINDIKIIENNDMNYYENVVISDRPTKKRKKTSIKLPSGFFQYCMKKIRKDLLNEGYTGKEKENLARQRYSDYITTPEFKNDIEEFENQILTSVKIEEISDDNNSFKKKNIINNIQPIIDIEQISDNNELLNNNSLKIKKEIIENNIQINTNNLKNINLEKNELELVVKNLKMFDINSDEII